MHDIITKHNTRAQLRTVGYLQYEPHMTKQMCRSGGFLFTSSTWQNHIKPHPLRILMIFNVLYHEHVDISTLNIGHFMLHFIHMKTIMKYYIFQIKYYITVWIWRHSTYTALVFLNYFFSEFFQIVK